MFVSESSLSESGLSKAANVAGRFVADVLLFDDNKLSDIKPPVGRTDGRPTSANDDAPVVDEHVGVGSAVFIVVVITAAAA